MSTNTNHIIRITTRLRTKYGLYSILRLKDDEDTYIYWLGIIEKLVPLELDFVKMRRLVQENNIWNNGKNHSRFYVNGIQISSIK